MIRLLLVVLLAGAGTAWAASPDGAALYAQNCALCHQADANGAAGQYPPLRGRVDIIAATPAGRHYLSDLLINGMAGVITANGARYVGYMPSFAKLDDPTIAAILDYLASLGATRPPALAAADIAGARTRTSTPTLVNAERKALAAQHPLP